MSFKTITRVAAGSVVLGAVVLAPSAAQAKNPPSISGAFTMAACPLTGFSDVSPAGSVGGATFNVSVPATNGTEYDVRIRYSVPGATATSPRVFSKSRDFLVTPTAGKVSRAGTLSGTDVRIYRIDVINTVAETLVYTSDGAAACD